METHYHVTSQKKKKSKLKIYLTKEKKFYLDTKNRKSNVE